MPIKERKELKFYKNNIVGVQVKTEPQAPQQAIFNGILSTFAEASQGVSGSNPSPVAVPIPLLFPQASCLWAQSSPRQVPQIAAEPATQVFRLDADSGCAAFLFSPKAE